MMNQVLKSLFLMMVIAVFAAVPLHADESKETSSVKKLEKIATKKVRGTVTSVGYQKISIETGKEGSVVSEMMIPVSEKANFRGRKALKDFQRGDTVDITFEQTFTEEKNEKTILKTSAIEILLIKNVESEDKMMSKEETVKS